MANKTTNFGLTKPLAEEFYDVNVQNENMDIIDEELKKALDSLGSLDGAGNLFVAEYGVTTLEEISEAEMAGKMVVCKYGSAMILPIISGIGGIFYNFYGGTDEDGYMATISTDGWTYEKYGGYTPKTHADSHKADGNDPLTADDIGAVPSDGESYIENGILYLENGKTKVISATDFACIESFVEADNSSAGKSRLAVYSTYDNIREAVRFVDSQNTSQREYLIYGEHNKPTLADLGGSVGKSTTATLTTSGWTLGSDERYYQTVSVEGVTAETAMVLVDVDLSTDDADARVSYLEAWAAPSANEVDQGAGTLTFYSYDLPTINIPINVGVM